MPFIPNYPVPEERQAYTFLNKSRTGVLVLHGFMGSPISSRPMSQFLHERGLTVHCPLLPGHGQYPNKLQGYSRHTWLAEVEEAYHHIQTLCDEVFIVGHSMGTVLGAHLILKYGGIKGIAMLAPVYEVPDRRLRWLKVLRYVMPWYYPHKSRKESMQNLIRERVHDFDPTVNLEDPAVQAQLPELTRVPTSAMDEMVRMIDLGRHFWPHLELPVRIFQGDHDSAVDPKFTQIIYGLIPSKDKKINIYPNVGHELMRPFESVHTEIWQSIYQLISEQTESLVA